MPLLIPDLVDPKAQPANPPQDKKKDDSPKESDTNKTPAPKKFDGKSAPGMEGMSEEAIRRFEEAMELEYQKREGGA